MGSSSSPQSKLPCFWKWIQIISGELMATGWEVGCKDWEQDVCFRLLGQTKEVVQGNPQSLYFTQQTPRHSLSCRASYQSCAWQADVRTPAPTAVLGRAGGAQQPSPECQRGQMGCGTSCKHWSSARCSLGSAHTCRTATAPPGQLQLQARLSSLASSHGCMFGWVTAQHSTACFIPQNKFPNTTQHHKPGTITLWQTHTTVMGQL